MVSKVTKNDIKYAKEIYKANGVKVEFINEFNEKISGYFNTTTKTAVIFLKNNITSERFWTTTLHELVHGLCAHNNVYKEYHSIPRMDIIRKHGYKAENFVEDKAEILCSFYCPNIKYQRVYKRNTYWKTYFRLAI